MNAEGLVFTSGAIAFAGSFKQAGGIPPNTLPIIIGTTSLAIFASFADGTQFQEPVMALAALMLLAAAIRYIPGLSTNRKVKKNG